MGNPAISIIIPPYNRPHLLPRAVQSALEQTVKDLEVVVVDDGSTEPLSLTEECRLRIIRLPKNSGTAAARNAGAKAARGRWITYLDDDDRLLPHMAAVSLEALAGATLPQPVAVISGLAVVDSAFRVLKTRLPPTTLPRGSHFFLEEIEPGKSYACKQTLVVEREVFLSIGGYDESFSSRVPTEFFLRLNPVCSILGLSTLTYQLFDHEGPRISSDPRLRQASFSRLVDKHRSLFEKHPNSYAEFLYKHSLLSYLDGQKCAALASFLAAVRIQPLQTTSRAFRMVRERVRDYRRRGLREVILERNS
jgi:glycosyltransferase involved in cell wall biosynthesis